MIPELRIWHKKRKLMAPVVMMEYDLQELDWKGNHGEWAKWDEVEFMQFTETLDKNGRRIYEGDIVQLALADQSPSETILVGAVIFEQENARFAIQRGGAAWPLLSARCEVRGNIYENPELLNA